MATDPPPSASPLDDVEQYLLDSANDDLGLALTKSDVTFDPPVLVDDTILDTTGPERNSSIVVRANNQNLSVAINYNRLSLPKLFELRSTVFDQPYDVTLADLLVDVNARLGAVLSESDFGHWNGPDGDGNVDLVVSETSLAYFGTQPISLTGSGVPSEYPIMAWNVALGDNFKATTGFLIFPDDSSNPQGRTDGWFAQFTEAPLAAYDNQSPMIAWRAYDLENGPQDAEYNSGDGTYAYHFGGASPGNEISTMFDFVAGIPSLNYDDGLPHPDADFMREAVFEIEFSFVNPSNQTEVVYYLTSTYSSSDGGFSTLTGPTGTFGKNYDVVVNSPLEYNLYHPDGDGYSYIAGRIPLSDIFALIHGTSIWDGTTPLTMYVSMWLYGDSAHNDTGYVEVLDATSTIEPDSYSANQIVGRNGFALAAFSRMVLVDQFNTGEEVDDSAAPTGFTTMVAGENGEIWAFKNDAGGLKLAYSDDRGEAGSWSQMQFPADTWLDPDDAVFFKGFVYANIADSTSGPTQTRICRLRRVGEGWEWEPVFELARQANVTSFAADENTMVFVSNSNLHITEDGVSYVEEVLNQATVGETTPTLSEHTVALRNGQVIGTARGTGDYWNNRTLTFVRRGPNDYVFDEPLFYAKSATEDYSPSGLTHTFVVEGRWFLVLQTAVSNGSGGWDEPVHGAIWYTDDEYPEGVSSWTNAAANPGLIDQHFAYDGARILLAGKSYMNGGSGWAGLSTDNGATWQFDSDSGTAFGSLRNEAYLAVRRVDNNVSYPTVVEKPVFVPELLDQPTVLVNGSMTKQVLPLSGDAGAFAVVGDWLKTDSNNPSRDGIYVFNNDGSLSRDFDCSFVRGHLEYGNNEYDAGNYVDWHVVSGIAESGANYVIVGNFNEVNGEAANGIAKIDRVAGANVAMPSHSWLSAAGNPAYLKTVSVDKDSGKIYVGGTFVSVDGHPTVGVARLNSDGTLDTSFTSALTATAPTLLVTHLTPWRGGMVLVDGVYSAGHPVLLNNDGTINADFPLSSGSLTTAFVDADDRLNVFGFGLNGSSAALRVTESEGVFTNDSSFMASLPGDVRPYCAGTLGGDIFVFQEKPFTIGTTTFNRPYFCTELGEEAIDYSDLYSWSSLAIGQGSQMAASSEGIMFTGQFEILYQSTYPRVESVARHDIAFFRPAGFTPAA